MIADGRQLTVCVVVASIDTRCYSNCGFGNGARSTRLRKVARALMRLGPSAFWPMVERVAFKTERGTLTNEQWHAFGDGLLQALAIQHNPSAAPLFESVFANTADAELGTRGPRLLSRRRRAELRRRFDGIHTASL